MLGFSQQLQKWAKNSNVIYTLPDCDIFRSLFFLIQPLLQKEIQLIKVKCVGSNKSLNPAITKWSHIFHRTASLLLYLTLHWLFSGKLSTLIQSSKIELEKVNQWFWSIHAWNVLCWHFHLNWRIFFHSSHLRLNQAQLIF